MTIRLRVPNGSVSLCESKAECPHCERDIAFEEIEEKYMKQSESHFKMLCKCKRKIGITADMKGDFVAYEL